MQKLTVFSILLSLSVLLILGDIVYHDYLNPLNTSNGDEVQQGVDTQVDTQDSEPLMQDYVPENTDSSANVDTPTEDEMASVYLTEDSTISLLNSTVSQDTFVAAGFLSPVLKDTIFSGYIFNFIKFSDQDEPFIYQWNLFDGEEFIGAVYQIRYSTTTGSFQGYLTLRERASDLSELGTVNEVNIYGDSSFYFNHLTKTKTVHFVVKKGADVYAFEYAYAQHEQMKRVFELL